MKESEDKYVVVILPMKAQQVLMQLRDDNPNIDAPGCWGFWGGRIDRGESPLEAAKRELIEEIGLKVDEMIPLGCEKIWDLKNIVAYGFCCRMDTDIRSLRLAEGLEMKFVSRNEITQKKAYSTVLSEYRPIVPTYYIAKMFDLSLQEFRTRGLL